MYYGPYYVCMLPIPAFFRYDEVATCAEYALSDGRKTLDKGR